MEFLFPKKDNGSLDSSVSAFLAETVTLEHNLLLIWRHVTLMISSPTVAKLPTRTAVDVLLGQVGEVVGPVLQKVDGLMLVSFLSSFLFLSICYLKNADFVSQMEGIKYSGDLDFLKPTARKLQDLLVES